MRRTNTQTNTHTLIDAYTTGSQEIKFTTRQNKDRARKGDGETSQILSMLTLWEKWLHCFCTRVRTGSVFVFTSKIKQNSKGKWHKLENYRVKSEQVSQSTKFPVLP